VTRNAIGSLTTATSAIEAAFPEQFERNDDDELIKVDNRAVNFSQEARRDLRWGFNFTKVQREPTRPPRRTGAGSPADFDPTHGFRQRQSTEVERQGNGQNNRQSNAPPNTPDSSTPPPPPPAPQGSQSLDEVVVNGSRAADASPFGPPGGGGRFGGPGGGGGRAGARAGALGGGGPPGNRGGGRGGGFGSGNGAQLDVSLYHSWYFMDTVRLTPGSPQIDLLNGGSIGAGGQPRHQIQFNGGVIDNGIGFRLSGVWTSSTAVLDSGNGGGALYYSSLLTLDTRLFVNLQQRFLGKRWARNARVTLGVSNVFNKRQDIHNGAGVIPEIYQPAFLDPYGRTVGISLRKLF
jgi:hypothetical protein